MALRRADADSPEYRYKRRLVLFPEDLQALVDVMLEDRRPEDERAWGEPSVEIKMGDLVADEVSDIARASRRHRYKLEMTRTGGAFVSVHLHRNSARIFVGSLPKPWEREIATNVRALLDSRISPMRSFLAWALPLGAAVLIGGATAGLLVWSYDGVGLAEAASIGPASGALGMLVGGPIYVAMGEHAGVTIRTQPHSQHVEARRSVRLNLIFAVVGAALGAIATKLLGA